MSDANYRPEDLDPWGRPKPGAQPIGAPALEEVPAVDDSVPFGEAPPAAEEAPVEADPNVVPSADGSEPTPVTEVLEPAPLTDPADAAWEDGAQAPAAQTNAPTVAGEQLDATPSPEPETPAPMDAGTVAQPSTPAQTSGSAAGRRVYSTGKVAKEPQNLERELNQVLVDFVSGAFKVPEKRQFTPHIIAVEIGRRRGDVAKSPSAGAVTAAMKRWASLGYINLSVDKPIRFVSFTPESATKTLPQMKGEKRAAMKAAREAAKPKPVEVTQPVQTTVEATVTEVDVPVDVPEVPTVPGGVDGNEPVETPVSPVPDNAATPNDLPDVTA
jgi:hypothetical protein